MKKKKTLSHSLSRRGFLGAMGLGGAGLFLPSLRNARAAETGGATRPRRIIFIATELGWNPFDFRIAPPGAPEELLLRSAYHPSYRDRPDEQSWDIPLQSLPLDAWSRTLAPLYPYRDKVIALDGLSLASVGADRYGDAHAKGFNNCFTGFPSASYITGQKAASGAPSLDRLIANYLRSQDPCLTDLAGLNIRLSRWRGAGSLGFHNYFWERTQQGDVVPVIAPTDPRILLERLYPSTGVGPVAAGNRDVVDLLTERYSSSYGQLSREDRGKLDLHRDVLRDVQQRLEQLDAAQCSEISLRDYGEGSLANYNSNVENFLDLTVSSLACDLTRVVAIQCENANEYYGTADLDFHEWYSHGTNPPKRWINEDERVSQADHDKFLDAAPIIGNKNQHHVELMVRLADRLNQVPDGDGTLLDNTLIVLTDEISHGSHGHDQWPVVMLGGFGGAFRSGRYIRFPRTVPDTGINSMGPYIGKPHNHLLVSLAQAMGLPMEDTGLKEIYGYDAGLGVGRRIDLRGRLEELY